MKKTLVAVAALAFVGAASAQSSVTLYGKIDWEIVSKTNRAVTTGVKGNPGIKLDSAGLSGSRWGMKGSEDLGGGMSAIFDLQAGFTADDGLAGQSGLVSNWITPGAAPAVSRIFGRQAYAGLKGGFGQITAGRQYAPYDNAFGATDAQGYTSNSAMGFAFAGATSLNAGGSVGIHADANGPGRVDNHLTYMTPAMGGFNAQISWAPGENAVAATGVSAGKYFGIGLGYGNGPINIQFATESIRPTAAAGTTNAWLIGGSYDLGVVKPYMAYERAKNAAGSTDKGWALGFAAPVGPVTLQAGWAVERTRIAGAATSSKVSGLGAQVVYSLSKRTNVYAEWMNMTIESATAGTIDGKNRRLGVGMRHDF